MHRREGLGVEALEGFGRLEHLAHDEAGDRLRLGTHDQEADDRLDDAREQVAAVGVRGAAAAAWAGPSAPRIVAIT
jgi:hypothetical protein